MYHDERKVKFNEFKESVRYHIADSNKASQPASYIGI